MMAIQNKKNRTDAENLRLERFELRKTGVLSGWRNALPKPMKPELPDFPAFPRVKNHIDNIS